MSKSNITSVGSQLLQDGEVVFTYRTRKEARAAMRAARLADRAAADYLRTA